MGITERKEREKLQRRNDIIDAAEKIFFAKGLAASTMDEIAEAAELSKGTLYLYFKSKEDLYFAINIRGLKILVNFFESAVKSSSTGYEKVFAIGEAYVRFYQEYPDYFMALVYYESKDMNAVSADNFKPEKIDHGHDVQYLLVDALNQGVKDGSIRPDIDPKRMSIALWGMSTGIIHLARTKGDHLKHKHNVPMDDIVPYTLNFLKQCIANHTKG